MDAAKAPPPHAAKKSKKKTTPRMKPESGADYGGKATIVNEGACVDEEVEPENENSRLREQLLRVLVDYQRQEEEIVALRALARSLKEEVELIQKQSSRATLNAQAPGARADVSSHHEKRPHEFFKLDLQVEQLRAQNTLLRDELDTLRAFVNRELPQFKIIAVQARAELECVKSQLHDESAHCDRLEAQVAHYKVRTNVPVSAPAHQPLQSRQKGHDSNSHIKSEDFKNTLSHDKRGDSNRRERESFLLQCWLSAVKSGSDADKENSDFGGGNGSLRNTSISGAELKAASPPEIKGSVSRSSVSSDCSVASSGSCGGISRAAKLLSSSRVHRDLSVLDQELQSLHHSLHRDLRAAAVPHNGVDSKR